MLGPSLSTLLCRCDPIPLRSTVSGRFNPSPFGGTRARPSLSYLRCWGYPSPRYCVGAIPSLSALRYRDVSIPLRSAVLGRDHPSPVCGAGAIPLHSAVSVRSHPSPLYGIGTIPSLRSAVLGRDHPSPLCGVGAIPSLSALRYRDDSIPSPFGGIRARPSLSGLRCWGHPSPRCGVDTIPSLSALRYRDDSIPLRSAVLGRDHPSPICGAGAIPLHATVSVRSHPSPLYGIGTFQSLSVRRY